MQWYIVRGLVQRYGMLTLLTLLLCLAVVVGWLRAARLIHAYFTDFTTVLGWLRGTRLIHAYFTDFTTVLG